ncbi:nucleoside-diphosphate sugar epimerase/dehydratase, partial [Fusobacterium varium]
MNKKNIDYTNIIYVILLFMVYEGMFRVTGFSINTSVYGLFIILIFFYSITGNLKFNSSPSKCNAVLINGLIFGIYFVFYKSLSIFITFIVFSLFQLLAYRFIIKIKENRKSSIDRYLNIRSLVKFLIDSLGIILGIISAFIFKYGIFWREFFKEEYVYIYLGIFLIGYFHMRMNEKSWSYTNIIDLFNLITLNIISGLIFSIVILTKLITYPLTILLLSIVLAICFQFFCRYIFKMRKFYGSKNKCHNLEIEKRTLIYGAGEAGAILAKESMTNPIFPYQIVG